MKIQKSRIRNANRYLYGLRPGETFRIGVRAISNEKNKRLQNYGYNTAGTEEQTSIPIPLGTVTDFNVNGKAKIRQDLPKEHRLVERPWTLKDRGGTCHSGIWEDWGPFYQKQNIPPSKIPLTFSEGTLCSPPFKREDDILHITIAINMLLEMLGEFEILREDKSPWVFEDTKIKRVPWKLLPPGKRSKGEIDALIDTETKHYPERIQVDIRSRHNTYGLFSPDLIAYGSDEFYGYIVYGYSNLGLYFFESFLPDNATYVLGTDWENISKLTKLEILRGKLCINRIFHRKKWEDKIKRYFPKQTKLFTI